MLTLAPKIKKWRYCSPLGVGQFSELFCHIFEVWSLQRYDPAPLFQIPEHALSSWSEAVETDIRHDPMLEYTKLFESRHELLFGRALVEFIIRRQEQVGGLNKELMARQLAVTLSKIDQTIQHLVENPDFLDRINDAGKFIITHDALLLALEPIQKTREMKVVTIFHSNEHSFLNELKENCLDRLQDMGYIKHWNPSDILFGNRKEQIEQKIKEADCFIGLISMPYFGNTEVVQAHKQGLQEQKIFIPVIVRGGYYDLYEEINQNTTYPQENGTNKPLEEWNPRSEAWAQITKRLLEIKGSLNL